MSYLINNQQKVNEIIFAKRNKQYGAYAIRSTYGNTVLKSISFMLLGFGSFIYTAYYLSNRNDLPNPFKNAGQVIPKDSIYVIEVNNEEKKEEQKTEKTESKPPAADPSKDVAATIVKDSVLTKEATPTNSDMATSSTRTTTGDGGPSEEIKKGGNGNGTDTLIAKSPEHMPDQQAIFRVKGNLDELYKIVKKHLRYPEMAYNEGKGGTLYVRFVVNEDGSINNLILQNHKGFGLDEEALRVVAMIPNFEKPAIHKGVPVKSYFQLPIKFTPQ